MRNGVEKSIAAILLVCTLVSNGFCSEDPVPVSVKSRISDDKILINLASLGDDGLKLRKADEYLIGISVEFWFSDTGFRLYDEDYINAGGGFVATKDINVPLSENFVFELGFEELTFSRRSTREKMMNELKVKNTLIYLRVCFADLARSGCSNLIPVDRVVVLNLLEAEED